MSQPPPAQQQHISRVLIYRHFNPAWLGEQHNGMTQSDFVELYFHPLCEELAIENIAYDVAEEVTPLQAEGLVVPEFTMVLILSSAWMVKPPRDGLGNITQTMFTQPNSKKLAEELGEAVAEWGHCYAFGHRAAKPRKLAADAPKIFSRPQTKAVAIEPIAVNGPDVPCYLARTKELGEVLGRAVAGHLKARGQAVTHVPLNLSGG